MVGDEEFPSRSFLLYWRANLVSSFGTYVTLFALQTLGVLTLHGSAAEVGWLSSARRLPFLVVGVVVGALVVAAAIFVSVARDSPSRPSARCVRLCETAVLEAGTRRAGCHEGAMRSVRLGPHRAQGW